MPHHRWIILNDAYQPTWVDSAVPHDVDAFVNHCFAYPVAGGFEDYGCTPEERAHFLRMLEELPLGVATQFGAWMVIRVDWSAAAAKERFSGRDWYRKAEPSDGDFRALYRRVLAYDAERRAGERP